MQTPLMTQAVDLIQDSVKHDQTDHMQTAVMMLRHMVTRSEHEITSVVTALDADDLTALVSEMATQLGPIREWPPEQAA